VLGLVYLPYILEAKQDFGAPAGADRIEWSEEYNFLSRGLLQRCPIFNIKLE
jgi:hypothetical protein